jgi:hypothetical protein
MTLISLFIPISQCNVVHFQVGVMLRYNRYPVNQSINLVQTITQLTLERQIKSHDNLATLTFKQQSILEGGIVNSDGPLH